VHQGDTIIIISYGSYDEPELATYTPTVVHVDANNENHRCRRPTRNASFALTPANAVSAKDVWSPRPPQDGEGPSRVSARPAASCSQLDPPDHDLENGGMAASEIDDYLSNLDEPRRSTLVTYARRSSRWFLPQSRDLIWRAAFRLEGKTIAGFAAFQNHLIYLPHSGHVIGGLKETPTDTQDQRRTSLCRR